MKKLIAIGITLALVLSIMAVPAMAAPQGTNNPASTNVFLFPKDTTTWEFITDGAWAKVEYVLDGQELSGVCKGHKLTVDATYKLISYNDPWGSDPQSVVIDSGTADKNGKLYIEFVDVDLGSAPESWAKGYKIWLVPDSAVNDDGSFNGWSGESYLYESDLIHVD